jgi:ubiquinol-cytochrome c reductase iron-sulfur subunit
VSRLKDWLVALAALLLARRQSTQRPDPPIVEAGETDRRAETVLLALLVASTLCSAGIIVVYALDGISHHTQWLGLLIGLTFLLLAASCVLIGRRLVVNEELAEDYPAVESPDEQLLIADLVEESGSRFTRRRLVTLVGSGALGALGVALLTPLLSFGPLLDTNLLYVTPWRRGRRLVDEGGRPIAAADVEQATFYTAYPEGANRELVGSPLVVVRVPEGDLRLPPERRGWAPQGIVAYSKVCTHAGCAVALYRKPNFADVEPKPALVCPCHYSTFDPASGGSVLFGPAGRSLPQLPLVVDRAGNLRAAGNFSGPVGPSWWGVRMGKARS